MKNEQGFCGEQVYAQKPLSYFTQVSQFGRIENTFEVIFPEIHQMLISLFLSLSFDAPSEELKVIF
jgi:hypothetical protein